jgi:7,8-dihydro-6-hydroxymethylpterin-pyrophosphokinase
MKSLLRMCVVAVVVLSISGVASAALWEIQDAGLQDTTNFVDTGMGSAASVLNSRSDIAGDPGTRYNITLTGSGWQDITIGDDFDLPNPKSGLVAATGNSGNLSGYAGYAMTIHNPGTDAFMVAISMNTGWTDMGETDRYYQNGDGSVTWVGPGDTVTLTLDFGNAALWSAGWTSGNTVQNLNHVTNISIKIGSNVGNSGEAQSGVAFDVDVVTKSALWEIKDAGLQDTTNFVNTGMGSAASVLNSRSDIASDPGYRFNITLTGSGWQDITIGDDFDLPSALSGLAAATGNSGDLSSYRGYTMTIHNPCTNAFMVALSMNTGWTDIGETDRYYQNGDGSVTWVGPGDTVTLTLDFGNAALWSAGWTSGNTVQNLNHVTNISIKIGSNVGNSGEAQSGVAFDVDVVSNVLELNPATRYIQTTASLTTDMDVKHLLQRVNACQAMLGYDSKFIDPTAACVLAGGGVWDQVIYDSWAVGGTTGEIDTAIGVNAYGATGTQADGTVAKITLTAGAVEGTTTIIFRPDASPDPGLTATTFLSDMSASAVMPMKYDTCTIVIDGTAPIINIASAKQGGQELLTSLGSTTNAVQGTVNIQVTASDALAGLAGPPTVTVTDSGAAPLAVSYVNESPTGTFNYTATVTAATANGIATISATVADKSGNSNSDTDTFNVNKNQITGTVDMSTLSNASYSFIRNVVFTATDGVGTVLKSWTVAVSFNNPGAQVASGPYTLTDVPGTIANLSAKTAWSLRRKQAAVLGGSGQATVNFTGANDLLGGDINGSNSINILDYSVLKVNWNTTNAVADINGDGLVQLLDYSLMKSNWFALGDPQ